MTDDFTIGFCTQAFQHLKVNCEGNASMCCDQFYGTLGNILQSPFKEIWNGVTSKEIRECIKSGELHPYCKKLHCSYKFCNPNDKMIKIDYYLDQPITIELDLPNTHCNIGGRVPSDENPACIMCPRSALDFRPEIDNLKDVCEVISPLLKKLSMIHVQGIGEPFYQRKLFHVLNWLDFYKHQINNKNLQLSTVTNGTLFDSNLQKQLLDKCNKIRMCFSIDAGTPDTYKKIRRHDAYHVVKKNLLSFSKLRDPLKHELCINSTINTINIKECKKIFEDAAEAKVDWILLGPTDPILTQNGITVNNKNCWMFEEAEEEIKNLAKKIGIRVILRKPLHLNLRKQLLLA